MRSTKILVILALLLLYITISNSPQLLEIDNNEEYQSDSNNVLMSVVSTTYEDHDPIFIDGNESLAAFASSGDGSILNPYIIGNYNITNSAENLIHVQNTTAYFEIRDNFLNGVNGTIYDGIFLSNVTHGAVINNTISSCDVGIELTQTSNYNLITNNTVYNQTRSGISFRTSSCYNNITENVVFNNTVYGIVLRSFSNNTLVSNNLIYDILDLDGICLQDSSYNTILNNTIIDGAQGGMVLWFSSSFNLISNNTAYGNHDDGIRLYHETNNNTITYNNFSNNYYGTVLFSSSNNTVSNNIFNNNTQQGIYLYSSSNKNTIENNEICNNLAEGIVLYTCSFNTISNNYIFNSANYGIDLCVSSNSNIVRNNEILNSSNDGMRFESSSFNNLSYNFVSNNTDFGIYIVSSSYNNTFLNNTISYNQDYGIYIDFPPMHNVVMYNDFIDNDIDTSVFTQVYDYGTNTIFSYNHWNEWTSPDNDFNGIVDNPYLINGSANSNDSFPLVLRSHRLSTPVVMTPNGGEMLNGIITVQWTEAVDSWGQTINYELSYSTDSGSSWTTIINDLPAASYDWDTTTVSDGSNYLLKVVVTSTQGLVTEDISNGIFTIHNQLPSEPTINSPNGGETITGNVTIEWTASIDSLGHSVVYNLSYSANNGTTWTILAWDLAVMSYEWNTITVSDGSNYLLKVVATCSEGLISEDISDGTFSIHNQLPSEPTITYPNDGEIISGTVVVEWTESTDSLGHTVNYTILYSSDNGTNWTILAQNLVLTSYEWDTTTVSDGSNYLIKIIATCSEGLVSEDISDSEFTILNDITTSTSETSTSKTSTLETTKISSFIPGFEIIVLLFSIGILTAFNVKKRSK